MTILIAAILAPLTLLTFCFAVELFAGLSPLRGEEVQVDGVSVVIIVPAHNEESIIRSNLASLKDQAGGASILLVADNCSDATAQLGRSIGVEVVERRDPARRGKGFALDFAKEYLRVAPPAVVVIMDADCVPAPNSMEQLVAACANSGMPCQAVYLQRAARHASPALRLSTFAFFIKNLIRQRALQRISGRVNLLGTGMAFPWQTFEQAQIATSNIVEDLELGLELAIDGYPPLLVEQARVWSAAATLGNTIDQRRRWEGGYLKSAGKWGPRLLAGAIRAGDLRSLWTAISLFVPPIALLVTLDVAAIGLGIIAFELTGHGLFSLSLLLAALGLAVFGLLAAWRAGGSQFIGLRQLAQIPVYLLWKLPLYVGLARRGVPKEWLRTERD